MAFMAVFTTIILIDVLVLQISKQSFVMTSFIAVSALIIQFLYFVSASKVTHFPSFYFVPGAAGKRIATLARRVGVCLCGVVVSALLYTVADVVIPQNSVQLRVMVKVTANNLLSIMFHSLLHVLMAKYLIVAAKRNKVSSSRSLSKIVPSLHHASSNPRLFYSDHDSPSSSGRNMR